MRRVIDWTTLVASQNDYYKQETEWVGILGSIAVSKSDVSDPNAVARQYYYRVLLSVEDIAVIINTLAEQGLIEESVEIAEALKPSAVSLLRLALCVQENASKVEDLETSAG